MPIIKSAKKRLKQNRVRRARNFPLRSELKTVVKKQMKLIKEGSAEEAQKFMSHAYKIIDMAAKKNIIHSKNAARKKSRLAKSLNDLVKQGGKVVADAGAKAKDAAKDAAEEVKKAVK